MTDPVFLAAPLLLLLPLSGCGGDEGPRRRSVNDDDIAAFGAERAGAAGAGGEARETTDAAGPAATIELFDGERLAELRALIRFEAGGDAAPQCALYALRVSAGRLEEGRASVACDAEANAAELGLGPVEDARRPKLLAALAGARLDPGVRAEDSATPRSVHVWVETDRRRIDGAVSPIRWPAPGAAEAEAPALRSPDNLSEVWEAVMYPERYR